MPKFTQLPAGDQPVTFEEDENAQIQSTDEDDAGFEEDEDVD